MPLDDILRKIEELSAEEREILRREVDRRLTKPEPEEATSETVKAINKERVESHDERGIPLEDVVKDPKDEA